MVTTQGSSIGCCAILSLNGSNQAQECSTLNRNFVHSELIRVPVSTAEQNTIAGRFDILEKQTQRLANLYGRKIAALDALKKSLLNQAFTGNL